MQTLRNLSLLLFAFWSFTSFAMDLQTRRHPLCGVESYKSLVNDPRCPIAAYIEKADAACPAVYKQRMDPLCGYDTSNMIVRCEYDPNSRQPRMDEPADPELGCPRGYIRTETPSIKFCRHPNFGVERYESCRHSSHGVESYQTCAKPEFGIDLYASCSFYKTPEELAAYIDATNESVETYRGILPGRQAELFARVKSEQGLGCTIEKYGSDPLYDDIVADMKDQFFTIFGYPVSDALLDCSPEALKENRIVVTLFSLDCDAIPRDEVSSVAKPAEASDAQYSRFKTTCNLKKSYELLVDWYSTKLNETTLLLDDLAAKASPAERQRLIELQSVLKN